MAKTGPTYVSVDVETAGPNPGTYSLLSIGACEIFNPLNTFYIELKPTDDHRLQTALEISGLDWERLKIHGVPPAEAMSRFAGWVNTLANNGVTPVLVAFNAPFDWMFISEYFHRYYGENPFGYKALDIKAYYMGLHGVSWDETGMRQVSRRYLDGQNLKHHALQDAIDQAVIFRKMLAEAGDQVSMAENRR